MEKRVASILLLLSVEALLVVAGLSAAASSGDTDIIRLPSESEVVPAARKESGGETPWKCCNRPVIGPSTSKTPVWYCLDKFKHCECQHCSKVDNGHGYYCLDGYKGNNPGPSCTPDEHQGSNIVHIVVPGARKESGEETPWKCCNRPVIGPSTSEIPVWYCRDKLKHCECEHCSKVDNGHGYYCLDGYKGSNPGPSCTHDG